MKKLPSARFRLRRTSIASLGLLCLLPVPLMLASGCGGSTASKNGSNGNRLVIPLEWPARGRALPQAANSVRVQIIQGNQVVASQVAQRPTGDAAITTNFTIDNVPRGAVTVRITAHSDSSASLAEIAILTVPLTLSEGTNAVPPVTLTSTLTQLTLLPPLTQLAIGKGQEIVATPRNAAGQYVVALASNYVWAISDPTVISLTTNGDRATVSALKLGSATLTLTERESGLSVQTTITVTSQTETPPGSTYRYTLIADSASEVASFGTPRIDDNGRVWFVGNRKDGGKGLYAGENGTLNRYAESATGQFSDLGEVGAVSPSGTATVFTGTLRDSNDPGLFVLQNNVITSVTTEATDIRNISAAAVVNDRGVVAYTAQGDPTFADANTRNVYRWNSGLSQRVYQGVSTTAVLELLGIDADSSVYFRSSEGTSVSRIAPDGALTDGATPPFDPAVSAYTVIPQGMSIDAFNTRIRPDGSAGRRNRKGQIAFLATADDGRTLLVRADPTQ